MRSLQLCAEVDVDVGLFQHIGCNDALLSCGAAGNRHALGHHIFDDDKRIAGLIAEDAGVADGQIVLNLVAHLQRHFLGQRRQEYNAADASRDRVGVADEAAIGAERADLGAQRCNVMIGHLQTGIEHRRMAKVVIGACLQVFGHGEITNGAVAIDFDSHALHALEHGPEFDEGLWPGIGVPELPGELDRVLHDFGLAVFDVSVALAHARFRTKHPFSALFLAARVDAQHGAIGLINRLHHQVALLADEHGLVDLHVFEFDGTFAVHVHASGEHDFEIARSRE